MFYDSGWQYDELVYFVMWFLVWKRDTQDENFSCISFLVQEHEPELQPPEKATCEVDKDTDKSGGKSWEYWV